MRQLAGMCAMVLLVAVFVVHAPRVQAQAASAESADTDTSAHAGARGASWQERYERAPTAQVLYRWAEATKKQNDAAKALRLYSAALLAEKKPLSSQKRAAVNRTIEQLTAKVARVRVRLRPPDAHLQVDGEKRRLPSDGALMLNPGTHVLKGQRKDQRVARTLEAEAGKYYEVTLDVFNPSASATRHVVERSLKQPDREPMQRRTLESGLGALITMWSLAAVSIGGTAVAWKWYKDSKSELERCRRQFSCASRDDEQGQLAISLGVASMVTAVTAAFVGTGSAWTLRNLLGGEKGQGDAASLDCGMGGPGLVCQGRF